MPSIFLQQVRCLHPSSTTYILIVEIHKHQEQFRGDPQPVTSVETRVTVTKCQQCCSRGLVSERLPRENLLPTFSKAHLAFFLVHAHLCQRCSKSLLSMGFAGQQSARVYGALISSFIFLCSTELVTKQRHVPEY